MRQNGVLLHIGSLPDDFGIGALGSGAFSFVDFLADVGVHFWQVLPLGVTAYGDSPYQSPSAFAGNPYFIDLRLLAKDGLLSDDDLAAAVPPLGENCIDYATLFYGRYPILRRAFARFKPNHDYHDFVKNNSEWLPDFALFMALKAKFGFKSFYEWPMEFRCRATVPDEAVKEVATDMDFWRFLQFEFDKQLRALTDYAKSRGVGLIGDIPIYVAPDSADVWANPALFLLDDKLTPTEVAGVPPDYFSATGQLWGNPLYDWAAHKAQGYRWWHLRLKKQLEFFDKIRIDHFRGFESFYTVPYGAENAICGKWVKGPRLALFDGIMDGLRGRIIAEDLGIITEDVRWFVKKSGFPGMRVLQFAFDGKPDNCHLPARVGANTVYYTGTHDNNTLCGWFSELDKNARSDVERTLGTADCTAAISAVMKSRATLAIIPMQDYLGQGSDARMNTPGTEVGNWQYVLPRDYPKCAQFVKAMTALRKR